MKYSELPEQERAFLEEARTNIMGRISHDAWGFIAYNKRGTRFFSATRRCVGWQDTSNGNSMPFGGGNYWEVKYGEVTFIRDTRRIPVGGKQVDVRWCEGRTFSKITTDTKEITIPKQLGTKKDVLDFYKILVAEGQRDFLPLKMVNIKEKPSYSFGTFYYGLD